jgi:hypothetical protein
MWSAGSVWTGMPRAVGVNIPTEDKAEVVPTLLYVTVFACNSSSQQPFPRILNCNKNKFNFKKLI